MFRPTIDNFAFDRQTRIHGLDNVHKHRQTQKHRKACRHKRTYRHKNTIPTNALTKADRRACKNKRTQTDLVDRQTDEQYTVTRPHRQTSQTGTHKHNEARINTDRGACTDADRRAYTEVRGHTHNANHRIKSCPILPKRPKYVRHPYIPNTMYHRGICYFRIASCFWAMPDTRWTAFLKK